MESNGVYPHINFYGSEWGAMKLWLESELLDSYKGLARVDLTEAETQQKRGRVVFIEQMLGWPELYAAFNGPQGE